MHKDFPKKGQAGLLVNYTKIIRVIKGVDQKTNEELYVLTLSDFSTSIWHNSYYEEQGLEALGGVQEGDYVVKPFGHTIGPMILKCSEFEQWKNITSDQQKMDFINQIEETRTTFNMPTNVSSKPKSVEDVVHNREVQ